MRGVVFALGRVNVGAGDAFKRVALAFVGHLIIHGLEGLIVFVRGSVESS